MVPSLQNLNEIITALNHFFIGLEAYNIFLSTPLASRKIFEKSGTLLKSRMFFPFMLKIKSSPSFYDIFSNFSFCRASQEP